MNKNAEAAIACLLAHMKENPPSEVTANLFLKLLEKLDGGSADEAVVEDLRQVQRDLKALQTLVGMSRLK